MKLIGTLLLSTGLWGQATLTLTGPATALAGQTLSLNLSLAASAGLNLTGWEAGLTLPAGITLGAPGVSAAGVAAGKGIYCGAATCIVIGLSALNVLTNNPVSDGLAATLQVVLAPSVPSGALSLPLTSLAAANTAGSGIALLPGVPYTVTVLSKCDVNGDGVTDFHDVQLVIDALNNTGTCTLVGGCTFSSLIAVVRAALGAVCPL